MCCILAAIGIAWHGSGASAARMSVLLMHEDMIAWRSAHVPSPCASLVRMSSASFGTSTSFSGTSTRT